MSKVLLINDMVGYGKVALSAMTPVLSYMRNEVFNLPTALVSNTLDYGKFDILETTEHMKNSIRVWNELGFTFDAVSTGFIVSEEQAKIISDLCGKCSKTGSVIFTDPIMGDNGRLYNGVTDKTVCFMRKLIAVADYIIPNYTEAAYLTGKAYKADGASVGELHEMVDELRKLGAKSVVVTSCIVNGSAEKCVIGYDAVAGGSFKIDFAEIPGKFPGTGDIFSSILMGSVLEGRPLAKAAEIAMNTVRTMIEMNAKDIDKYKGIPLETCLEVIGHETAKNQDRADRKDGAVGMS